MNNYHIELGMYFFIILMNIINSLQYKPIKFKLSQIATSYLWQSKYAQPEVLESL